MGNEEFIGTVKNDKAFARLEELKKKGEELCNLNSPIFKPIMRCGDTDNTHRNAVITIEASSPVVMCVEDQKNIIAEMMLLADDVSVAHVKNGDMIRFGFGVRNIWSAD